MLICNNAKEIEAGLRPADDCGLFRTNVPSIWRWRLTVTDWAIWQARGLLRWWANGGKAERSRRCGDGTGSADYAKQTSKLKIASVLNIITPIWELGTNRADAVLHDTPTFCTSNRWQRPFKGDSGSTAIGIASRKVARRATNNGVENCARTEVPSLQNGSSNRIITLGVKALRFLCRGD